GDRRMNLAELIEQLIREEGLSTEEAGRVAAAMVRAQRGATPQNQAPPDLMNAPNRVNYGNETPEQAKQRWMQQEMEDPQGLFAGGVSSGGVFGESAVATESYDPGAVARTVNMRTQLGQMRTQEQMLRLLEELSRNREQ